MLTVDWVAVSTHCRALSHSLLYGFEDSHPLQNPSPLPPLWPWRFPSIAEPFPTSSSMALKSPTHCITLPHSLLYDLEDSHPLQNPSPLPPLWPWRFPPIAELFPTSSPPVWSWRFPPIAEPFPTPSSMALKIPTHCRTLPHSLLYGLEDFHPFQNPYPLPPLWPWRFPSIAEPFPTPSKWPWRFPFIAEPFPTPSSMALKGPIHFPHSLLYGIEDFDLSRKFCKYCLSLLCIMQSHLVVWRGNVTSTKYESVPGTDCQTFPILNQKHIKLSKMPYQQSVTQVFQGLIWKSFVWMLFLLPVYFYA